jgi:hypothetical protein
MSEDVEVAAATAVQGVAERHFGKDADWALLGTIKERIDAQRQG